MQPNQIPVPGHYDDLYYFNNHLPYKTEAAVYDPNSGAFTIARPAGAYFPNQAVFQPGDIPVPADYAGVGWTIPGVYRPSTGQFFVKLDQTAVNGVDAEVSNFSGAVGMPVVPIGAPLAYRMPPTAVLTALAAPQASAQATSTTVASAVLADQTPSTPAAPAQAQDQAPKAPASVVPSLSYAASNAAGTRQPWFTGTAAPGIVVDFFLSGQGVIGSKKVGSANVDANGWYAFQLPAGARNGAYTLLVKARGADGSSTPIASASFQIAPAAAKNPIRKVPSRVNVGHPARSTIQAKAKAAGLAHEAAAPARKIVVAKASPAAVVTTSVFDQAIQNLHKNRLNTRNES
jgi:hypothetical protein